MYFNRIVPNLIQKLPFEEVWANFKKSFKFKEMNKTILIIITLERNKESQTGHFNITCLTDNLSCIGR
jgi:hypothetical protein